MAIPTTNIKSQIYYHNGKEVPYIVWPVEKEGNWHYWEALGNSGKEATEELARARARRWIRDGQ